MTPCEIRKTFLFNVVRLKWITGNIWCVDGWWRRLKHNFVAALKKHKFVWFCFSLAHCGSSFIITKILGAPNIITIHVLFLEASVQTEKGRRRIGGKENRKGISIFLVFCTWGWNHIHSMNVNVTTMALIKLKKIVPMHYAAIPM